jgi:putative transposase
MPNAYANELRERAVRAYESRTDTYKDVAARFAIGPATLMRWVQRQRETGTIDPLVKRGGWTSPVAWAVLKRLVDQRPDQTCEELTRAYNRVAPKGRVHRSSIWRALRRGGYVVKKNGRGRQSRTGPRSKPNAPPSSRGRAR